MSPPVRFVFARKYINDLEENVIKQAIGKMIAFHYQSNTIWDGWERDHIWTMHTDIRGEKIKMKRGWMDVVLLGCFQRMICDGDCN